MEKRRWQDWVLLIGGVWLFVSPWILNTTENATPSWNAWILGILVVATAAWALVRPAERAPEWLQGLYGAWLVFAPWILGFATLTAAAWNAWIVGAGLILFALLAYSVFLPAKGAKKGGPSDRMVTQG